MNHNWNKKLHIFSGPTFSIKDFIHSKKGVEFHPPIKSGDLTTLELTSEDSVLIVDGYHGSIPSITHEEIIETLKLNTKIYGCSGIGALRASELYPVGMIPMGFVANAYTAAWVIGDDEVAALHDPVDYQMMTYPLINIRFALAKLQSEMEFDVRFVEQAISTLKSVSYEHRNLEYLESIFKKDILKFVLSDEYNIMKIDALRSIETLCAIHELSNSRSKTIFAEIPKPREPEIEWQ